MKKFTIIQENDETNHEFEILKDYICGEIKLPRSDNFEFNVLDAEDVKVDYDEHDSDLLKVEIFVWEERDVYSDTQALEALKFLGEINDLFAKVFKDYLVLQSLHPNAMQQYKFTYHIKIKDFYNDPLWKSKKAVKKYNL